MIRLAHFSDLHYAGATLTEVDRCFSFAVDAAIAREMDCAVISGDSTDHALEVHAPAVAALARNVRRLADHCPVLMLHGTFSHEPPGALSVFRLLGGRFRVHVADRLQQVALTDDGRWLESEGWRFEQIPQDARTIFSCVPTVNKAIVAAAVGEAGRQSLRVARRARRAKRDDEPRRGAAGPNPAKFLFQMLDGLFHFVVGLELNFIDWHGEFSQRCRASFYRSTAIAQTRGR